MSLLVAAPLFAGCASRTAPFNELDQSQVTVLKLQGQQTAPVATTQPVVPGLPPLAIPGITPEMQQQAQQALEQFTNMLPPGVLPPGLLPGQTTTTPVQTQQPTFKGFVILAQTPLTDEDLKEELLDVFGDPDSFNEMRGQCFTPGMGVVFQDPEQPAPVELLISLSCNQAMGDGFAWPHPNNGFTPETSQRLSAIYQQLWGPIPPSGV